MFIKIDMVYLFGGMIVILWVIAFFLVRYQYLLIKRYLEKKNESNREIPYADWSYIENIRKFAWANYWVGALVLIILIMTAVKTYWGM